MKKNEGPIVKGKEEYVKGPHCGSRDVDLRPSGPPARRAGTPRRECPSARDGRPGIMSGEVIRDLTGLRDDKPSQSTKLRVSSYPVVGALEQDASQDSLKTDEFWEAGTATGPGTKSGRLQLGQANFQPSALLRENRLMLL